MQSLTRYVAHRSTQPARVELPWRTLRDAEIDVLRGDTTMVAAKPGSGKSALAMAFALQAQVPSLYMCADTSPWTTSVRLGAATSTLRGERLTQAEMGDLAEREPDTAAALLGASPHLAWEFNDAPTPERTADTMNNYRLVHGHLPDLVVVDNLLDAVGSDAQTVGDEWGTYRRAMLAFRNLARDYDTAVMVLHHVSDSKDLGHPPPRAEIMGRVSQHAATTLTVRPCPGGLQVAKVKARGSECDPSGQTFVTLGMDWAAMHAHDQVSVW